MAAQVSETRAYTALLSTTLENWAKTIGDTVTSSMFLWYWLKRSGSWISVEGGLGERCKFPLRTDNNNADSFSGYDQIPVVPMDGMTSVFFNWCQCASTITINGLEKRQNSGEFQMLDLLQEKTDQTMDGIREFFAKAFMQGNGINTATAITTAYTSSLNGSVFFTPLPLLIGNSPTSGTVGSLACNATNGKGQSIWANQRRAATDTNYATLMKDLRGLYNDCGKGVGGFPDTHLTDQATAEFYEAVLASFHHNTSYARADIPFDNVLFRGKPVVWDEFFPNWSGGTTVQSTTQGTWVMINSKFLQVKYDSQTNFKTTPFVTPENQDCDTAKVLWYGTVGTNNRRKHGVLADINTTLTS